MQAGSSSPPRKRSSPPSGHADAAYGAEHDVKRRRVQDGPSSEPSSSRASPADHMSGISAIALIYYAALSAAQHAHYHLVQATVPATVTPTTDPSLVNMSMRTAAGFQPFVHDPKAMQKAVSLLVYALDLFRLGLGMNGLSDEEKVRFGTGFATIAIKLQAAQAMDAQSVNVVWTGLQADLESVVNGTLAISRDKPYLGAAAYPLELYHARMAFQQQKTHQGKRITRQYLSTTPVHDVSHRYALQLQLLEYCQTDQVEFAAAAILLEAEALANGHTQIVQLIRLARLRAAFVQRDWEGMASFITACAETLATDSRHDAWAMSFESQYLLLRALWEARVGDDASVKTTLKRVYMIMDDASDHGVFLRLRRDGGVFELCLPSQSGEQHLLVQATPPNILWALAFLTAIVSRRDFLGPDKSCRNLTHIQSMREFETVTRADELWDTGFSPVLGPADAIRMRNTLAELRAEAMLEHVTVLMWRSKLEAAVSVLHSLLDFSRAHDLLDRLSPHIALLHGHLWQLMGLPDLAERYYLATASLLRPHSELGLVVDINLACTRGHLKQVAQNKARKEQMEALIEKGRNSDNANLRAVCSFVDSLLDEHRASSKRKLTVAYELAHKGNNNTLRAIIFAFTTASHVYGNNEKQMRQLEAGADLARLLGGVEGGVGMTVLGLWYGVKLRDRYRMEEMAERQAKMQTHIDAHLQRIDDIKRFAAHCRHPDTRHS